MAVADQLRLGITVFVFTANLLLAFFVYKNNSKNLVNRLFGALSLVTSFWVLVMYVAPDVNFFPYNLFWIRFSVFLAVPQVVLIWLLANALVNGGRVTIKTGWLDVVLILSVAAMILTMSPYVFSGVRLLNGEFHPDTGAAMPLIAILLVGLSAAALVQLLLGVKFADGVRKRQLWVVLEGILLMLALTIVSIMIPVMLWRMDYFVRFSPLYVLVFLLATAYAVARHSLFDVRALLVRTASFLVFIGLLASAYALLFFLLGKVLFGIEVGGFSILVFVAMTGLAVLTFQPIERLARKLTNKVFFASNYDSDELLARLTKITQENLDFSSLGKSILKTLTNAFNVENAALVVVENHRVVDSQVVGYKNFGDFSEKIDALFHGNLLDREHFIFEDLEEGDLKNLLKKNNIYLAKPIRVENEEVAILILGQKLSGESYYDRDINLLDVYASESGLAIKNARLFSNLKFASEAKTRFISVVSHQLRTPVSKIKWSLEMIKGGKLKMAELTNFSGNAYSATMFLNEQLDNILTALDIYDNKVFIKMGSFRFKDFLKDLIKEFMPLIKEKKLSVDYLVSKGVSEIKCDEDKISRVVRVLFKNAIHYSKASGNVEIAVSVDPTKDGKQLVFAVTDDGIGINKKEGLQVFDEFFRSDDARLMLPDGLGLGLFIARSFVLAHGGRMWFKSGGKDRGASFYFTLPLA